MDITFNFIGMCVAEWQPAYQFFTQTLGFQAELNSAHGDWANLGAAWNGYYHGTYSMVCELFDQGKPVSERWWGHHQNVRPAIHVQNLDSVIEQFKTRGVNFSGDIETRPWGKQIEFETTEGIRWALAEHQLYSEDLTRPHFGHVALKTADFEAQKSFYGQYFTLESSGEDYAMFAQSKTNHPFIILEKGGEIAATDPAWTEFPERAHPFFLSFMTADIHVIHQSISTLNSHYLRPITKGEDWGGTDMIIRDADGNPIQIVQYG